MSTALPIAPRFLPPLDPGFVPASLWNRAYRSRVAETGGRPLAVALERSDGSVSVFQSAVLPHAGGAIALNHRYVERLLKFLLWQKGGWRVTIAGEPRIADYLRAVYSPTGGRAFDDEFMGERVYGRPMSIESANYDAAPAERETAAPLVVVQIITGILLGPGILGAVFPRYYAFVFNPAVVQSLNGIAWRASGGIDGRADRKSTRL